MTRRSSSTNGADWALKVVCVSPTAHHRGDLTLAALRASYAHLPGTLDHVDVCFDDRDSDRKMYAPAFSFVRVPDPAQRDVAWEDWTYTEVMLMSAISDAQGRALRYVIERCRPRFAANGAPGFNVGPSPAGAELTAVMQRAGIVEEASSALTLTIEEQSTYFDLLPDCARHVALESRVAFPLTARGKTEDLAGSYGRQFRDSQGKPTHRPKAWYVRLATEYASELSRVGGDGPAAAAVLRALAAALEAADLEALAAQGRVVSETMDTLGALLYVCDPFMTPEVSVFARDTWDGIDGYGIDRYID